MSKIIHGSRILSREVKAWAEEMYNVENDIIKSMLHDVCDEACLKMAQSWLVYEALYELFIAEQNIIRLELGGNPIDDAKQVVLGARLKLHLRQ
mgnify:CR=1 FL=1|tara:strand:- start:249 stop:530 length:282 start_codon:yes stop_codon:yes gene_type:complete